MQGPARKEKSTPASPAPRRAIRPLPESLANQIAAGEVVERPASVVKELVENSLDAGARRIEVEIREGGREYIRVQDDGVGIPEDQVLLAFERHATSKIAEAADLFSIRSLGFRGEALPSIASVSEVEFRTRTREQEAGVFLHLEGGRVLAHRPEGCSPGTTVVVRRLFFNTPARYKFLRSPASEGRHVLDVVGRLALAHPGCSFTLISNGRKALQTLGDGDMREAIAGVFGRPIAKGLLPLETTWPGGRLQGWLGRPELHRGNRDLELIILNGRPIHAPALLRAVEKGYETLLPSRRFPVALLHLELDPGLVDVNVHPAKREVRFADESDLFRRILSAVREALLAHNLYPSWPAAAFPAAGSTRGGEHSYRTQAPPAGEDFFREGRNGGMPSPSAEAASQPGWWPPVPPPAWKQGGWPRPSPPDPPPAEELVPAPGARAEPVGRVDHGEARRRLRELQLVGVLNQTFLLGIAEGQLWVIDQHIAHERVLYERLLARPQSLLPSGMQQRLLHPVLLEVTAREAALLEEQQTFLAAAGFSLEPFGPRCFRLTGIPASLSGWSPEAIEEALREALLGEEAAEGPWEARARRLAASLACRMALKAGEPLSLEMGRQLLEQLAETENPFTCPHGRPIVVIISHQELERRFGRH